MAEFTAAEPQVVQPGGDVVFTITSIPCVTDSIMHEDGASTFSLRGNLQNGLYPRYGCRCNGAPRSSLYDVKIKSNIAVNTGATPGEISIAIAMDGSVLTSSTMRSTPAAAEEYNSVSTDKVVQVACGCCPTISIRNTSMVPILVAEPLLDILPASLRGGV